MTETALILIDIQNDYFPGGLMPLDRMEAAAAQAALLLEDFRAREAPLFHIRHVAASAAAPFFRPGEAGSEIHPAVAPRPGEPVLVKARPNSFLGTGLEAALRAAGVGHVVLCGAMSQMCVDAAARAAADLGFRVTVAEDACAAASVRFGGVEVASEAVHAAIMAPLAASYAEVTSAAAALARGRAAA